jgi:hypothetical protein
MHGADGAPPVRGHPAGVGRPIAQNHAGALHKKGLVPAGNSDTPPIFSVRNTRPKKKELDCGGCRWGAKRAIRYLRAALTSHARNRITHHEPVIAWDLRKHHKKMVELTRWLSPAAAAWCRENDRFEQVYPAERVLIANIPKDAAPSS